MERNGRKKGLSIDGVAQDRRTSRHAIRTKEIMPRKRRCRKRRMGPKEMHEKGKNEVARVPETMKVNTRSSVWVDDKQVLWESVPGSFRSLVDENLVLDKKRTRGILARD